MPPLDKWKFGCRFGTAIHGGRFAQLNAPRAEFNFCCRPATGMAPEPCQHPNRVKGVVELDFARQDDSGDRIYTAPVSVGVCEDCGHIELYAMFHQLLRDWLRKS